MGYWSSIDILMNPYADSVASKGGALVHAFLDADVAIRHPEILRCLQGYHRGMISALSNIERRFAALELQGGGQALVGYAAVFNQSAIIYDNQTEINLPRRIYVNTGKQSRYPCPARS